MGLRTWLLLLAHSICFAYIAHQDVLLYYDDDCEPDRDSSNYGMSEPQGVGCVGWNCLMVSPGQRTGTTETETKRYYN